MPTLQQPGRPGLLAAARGLSSCLSPEGRRLRRTRLCARLPLYHREHCKCARVLLAMGIN